MVSKYCWNITCESPWATQKPPNLSLSYGVLYNIYFQPLTISTRSLFKLNFDSLLQSSALYIPDIMLVLQPHQHELEVMIKRLRTQDPASLSLSFRC